jgi:hypothetical protein
LQVDAIELFRRASEEGVVVRPGTRFTTINRFRNGIRRKPVHRARLPSFEQRPKICPNRTLEPLSRWSRTATIGHWPETYW